PPGGRAAPALLRALRAAASAALARGSAGARGLAARRAVAPRASGAVGPADRLHPRVADRAEALGSGAAVVPGRRARRRGRVPVRRGLDRAGGERGSADGGPRP